MDIIQYVTGGNVTIQAALISSLSILFSAIISFFIAENKIDKEQRRFEITLQSKKTTTYKELITSERIKWLNGLRDNISNIMKIFFEINMLIGKHDNRLINDDKFLEQLTSYLTEQKYNIAMIKLKVNPNKPFYIGVLDNGIIFTNAMVFHIGKDDYVAFKDKYLEYVTVFTKRSQEMLKEEWGIIKEEANQLYNE